MKKYFLFILLLSSILCQNGYSQAMLASYQPVNYVPNFITAGMKVRYEVTNASSYSGTGTTIYDLMSNVNGTLVNSPIYSNSSGTYLTLSSGSSQYVRTNNIGASSNESVFLWIYPTGNGVVLSEIGQTTINSGWHDSQIEINGGNILFNVWPYTIHGGTAMISTAISLNTWHYVGFTYNGSTLRGFVDGASVGTKSISRDAPTNLYYGIGATDATNSLTSGGGGYGNFRLGAFHYFSRALTINEVLLNYTSQVYKYTLKTCKDLAGSTSPSGTYYIDPDESGPNAAYQAYCDNTMDGGGWTLVAIRASSNANQIFTETVASPLLTSAATGRVSSADWHSTSTFPFNSIKFTNLNNETATATFASQTSISALNTTYSSYVSTATNATVSSTDARLVKFYWRAQSGSNATYSDNSDWAYICFANTTITNGDSWDIGQGYWILAGTDNTYSPATHTNVAVGKPAGPSSTAGAHWWGNATNLQTNSGSFYTKTFVWLK